MNEYEVVEESYDPVQNVSRQFGISRHASEAEAQMVAEEWNRKFTNRTFFVRPV